MIGVNLGIKYRKAVFIFITCFVLRFTSFLIYRSLTVVHQTQMIGVLQIAIDGQNLIEERKC